MLNTERFDTILEDDILESAEEVEKINQKLGKGSFSEENIITPVMGGELNSGGSDEGKRVGRGDECEELVVLSSPVSSVQCLVSTLGQGLKPGLCQAWQDG